MATTITMPQLGETVTEGTVAQWLKKPGDAIEKYEAFVEVSTDKVNAEVPSPVTGVLREIIAKEGETVATGAAIAIIDEAGAASADAPVKTPAPEHIAETVAPPGYGSPGAAHNGTAGRGNANGSDGGALPRRTSPAVRRLAREHSVELALLRGTGENGRITASDVIAAAAAPEPGAAISRASGPEPATRLGAQVAQPAVAQPAVAQPAVAQRERSTYSAPLPGTLVPLSPARKLIAKRMVESLAAAPHAWTMVEVDVTSLWAWRSRAKERFLAEKGYPLTLLPFFIHAVVQALKTHPLLNARFTDDGVEVFREYNIGIAIGLDSNLVVPVVRNADTLSIAGLAMAAGALIDKARSGKLGADELGGGTFTVNNTGANGSVLSKPIINGGQAAIVTMETVVKRPVVIDDAIAIRSMMNVCLSLDHRVIDGTLANAFTSDLKKRLEAMGPSGDL